MIEITRRLAIQILGSAAIVGAAPEIAQAKEPSAELLALRERVQFAVDAFDKQTPFAHAQYAKIFRKRVKAPIKSAFSVALVRYSPAAGFAGQPVVYRVKHDEVELGFTVSIGDMDDPAVMIRGLCQVFKELREISAVKVFDAATVYDPYWAGDGVCMCSDAHPVDNARWSNTLGAADLNATNLMLACARPTQFVDDQNLRIEARAKLLVVPVAQMDTAERLTYTELRPSRQDDSVVAMPTIAEGAVQEKYMVWDYLTDNGEWFVITDIDGLVWSEHEPFSIRVEMDADKNEVQVIGREVRGFGCIDPRAVVGAFPKYATYEDLLAAKKDVFA